MKKLVMLMLILVTLLGLVGCSNLEIASMESNTSHKMKASYTMLSGTKEGHVTVKEGEPVDVSVDIKTKSGKIDVYIYKDKEDYDYEGKEVQTSNFTVTLTDPGKYTILVKARKHKGGYTFTW